MSQNYILTENYFDDNNNQYFLIENNLIVDLVGKTYPRIIAKYYCSNNIELLLKLNSNNYIGQNGKEYQVNGNFMQNVANSSDKIQILHSNYGIIKSLQVTKNDDKYLIEEMNSTYEYIGEYLVDTITKEEYQVTEKNSENIPIKVDVLIVFQDNSLYPYESREIHETIQYVQKNYHRLNDSIEMSLITDNDEVDYLTLSQDKWLDGSKATKNLYKQYSYYQLINIKDILSQQNQTKGNVKSYNLIISPIDIYTKQDEAQVASRTAYTKNKSSNSNYYYITATKLPKTKVFTTPTSYYLKNQNGYIQNIEDQNYKLDYYVLDSTEKIANFYVLDIDYPIDMDTEKMPQLELTYYESNGKYICLNELPEDDIRQILLSSSGTLAIPLKDNTVIQVDYEIKVEDYTNISNVFNDVYSVEEQIPEKTLKTVQNRTIYNSCNIRASQIETTNTATNIIFASDAKPTEDIKINILLLKNRQLFYSIGEE